MIDERCVWSLGRFPEALELLAETAGFHPVPIHCAAPAPDIAAEPAKLNGWVDLTCASLGIEAEAIHTSYAHVPQLIRQLAPAVLMLPEERLLLLVGNRGSDALVLSTDGRVRRVHIKLICAELRSPLEARFARSIDSMVGGCLAESGGLMADDKRRAKLVAALLAERCGALPISCGWLLRRSPGAEFSKQLRGLGLGRRIAEVLGFYGAQYLLGIFSWWLLSRGVLVGRTDRGWLIAWALVVVTLIPLRLASLWVAGLLSYDVGALLKLRLLAGALSMHPDEVRPQGVGQLLGRVAESSWMETLLLNGGVVVLLALLELFFASWILRIGAAGLLHLVLLAAWILFALALTAVSWRRRVRWTQSRLSMTHDLIERMVGHRTRLAQQPVARWHESEDEAVARYAVASADLDQAELLLAAVLERGWLILGVAGLLPALLAGRTSITDLVIAVGGVVLAARAFRSLSYGLSELAEAAAAFREVRQLFAAAARRFLRTPPEFSDALARIEAKEEAAAKSEEAASSAVLFEVRDLGYRYEGRPKPVLSGVNLRIYRGERLLLQGPSGGGKSTLGAILAGLRSPSSGLLLLRGLDPATLGMEGWRGRVVSAPQFHDNHIFSATLAFNLLLGRVWPPRPEDLSEAQQVCVELGLGPLLARMPSGLMQIVGDTGWQLSHGERSRIYLARALLQSADLVILDESFGALDGVTLSAALECALRRARTLVVIAHP